MLFLFKINNSLYISFQSFINMQILTISHIILFQSMFVSFEWIIECSPLLVTNVKIEITSLWPNSNIFFTGIYRCCSNIYNIFIKYIVFLLWNTFKILPRHGCIWINRIFTLVMDQKIVGKRSMECKRNNSKGVYSEK
jgi:hypothetical protein